HHRCNQKPQSHRSNALSSITAYHEPRVYENIFVRSFQALSSPVASIVDRHAAMVKAQTQTLADLYVMIQRTRCQDDEAVRCSRHRDVGWTFCYGRSCY